MNKVDEVRAQIMELNSGIDLDCYKPVHLNRTWAKLKAAEVLQRRIQYCRQEQEDIDLDDYVEGIELQTVCSS